MDTNTIVVGAQIIRGKVHCARCGKYVNGHIFIPAVGGDKFVCNVQCGINYIAGGDNG